MRNLGHCRRRAPAAALVALALTLGACGEDGGDATTVATTTAPAETTTGTSAPQPAQPEPRPARKSEDAGGGGAEATPPPSPAEPAAEDPAAGLDIPGATEAIERVADALRSPEGQRFRDCIREEGGKPPPIPKARDYVPNPDGSFGPGAGGPEPDAEPLTRGDYRKLQRAREACADLAPEILGIGAAG